MEGERRGHLIDCAECWRLEERGMRRGGKGKENRGLNPSLRGGKRGMSWHAKTEEREVERVVTREEELGIRKRWKPEVK